MRLGPDTKGQNVTLSNWLSNVARKICRCAPPRNRAFRQRQRNQKDARGALPAALERLENRALLATFVESGSQLEIELAAGDTVEVVSQGDTYSLTAGSNWVGTDSARATGSGSQILTVTAAGLTAFDTLIITDSGSGAAVELGDSGSHAFEDSIIVTLDAGGANEVTFSGSTTMSAGASLSASADGDIRLQADSTITTSGGDLTLRTAGGTILLNSSSVNTGSGRQTWDGPVQLGSDAILSGGDVTVTGPVNATTYTQTVQAAGPVGYWQLSEQSGTTATDAAAGGNNGTYQGGVTLGANGPTGTGSAATFDGTNDAVLIGNPQNLRDLPNGLTISAWVRPVSTQQAAVISKWNQDPVAGDAWGLFLFPDGNGNTTILGAIGVAGDADNGISGGTVPLNQFSHVAMTYDVASGENRIFLNGAEVASRVRTGGVFASNTDVFVGREDNASVTRFFDGTLDDVAVFPAALSPVQIRDQYNASSVSLTVNAAGDVQFLDAVGDVTALDSVSVNTTGGTVFTRELSTAGGSVDLTADGDLTVADVVNSVGGNITFSANQDVNVLTVIDAGGGDISIVAARDAELTNYRQTVLADSPLAWYRLGESSGTTASDGSGNANHGNYTGSVNKGKNGALAGTADSSAEFNGSDAMVASSGDNTADDLYIDNDTLTLEAWINPTALATAAIAGKMESSRNDYILYLNNGRPAFGVKTDTGERFITAPADAPLNQWTHVIGTYDGSRLQLYVNGERVASTSKTGNVVATAKKFEIGRRSLTTSIPFTGRIDEVSVYGHALTTDRIVAHYNAGSSLPQLQTTGTSSITVTAERSVVLKESSQVTAEKGAILLRANQQSTATAGGFSGVLVDASHISASDGDVKLEGRAGTTGCCATGVQIINGSTLATTATGAGLGDIDLIGTGGGTASDSRGVNIEHAGTAVTTVNGNISVNGVGGPGGSNRLFNYGVRLFDGAVIRSTGAGAIDVSGTGGLNGRAHSGVRFGDTTTVQANTGSITLVGTAPNDGTGSRGVDLSGNLVTAGGAITVTGVAQSAEAGVVSNGTLNSAGGDVTMSGSGGTNSVSGIDAGNGAVHLASGIFDVTGPLDAAGIVVEAEAVLGGSGPVTGDTTVQNGGAIAPGASTDRLTIDGDVTFQAGSRLEVEIDGTTVGTGYDQLQVTGASRTVSLGDARLVVSGSLTPVAGDSFTLLDLTASSSLITGRFLGLESGDLVSVGGATTQISYANRHVDVSVPLQIGNRVWEDRNGDGFQDTDEPGIDGVTVRLLDSTGLTELAVTKTSKGGIYTFRPTTAAEYIVEFVVPQGFNLTSPNQGADDRLDSDADSVSGRVTVDLTGGTSKTSDVDAGLVVDTSQAAIGDFIFRDDDRDGIQDSGEPGLADVTVRLLNAAGTVISSLQTDETGHYDFQGLLPGSYFIEVDVLSGFEFSPKGQGSDPSADSDVNTIGGRSDEIVLGVNEKNISVDAGMMRRTDLGSIGDRVWRDVNENGIQDAGEPGVANVLLELRNVGGTVIESQRTDEQGRYLFSGLSAGTYQVQVRPGDGVSFTARDQGTNDARDSDFDPATGTAVVVHPGNANIFVLDAGLKPVVGQAAVGGRVWYDRNQNGIFESSETPRSRSTVRLLDATASRVLATTRTNQWGSYSFPNLFAGDYIVAFSTSNSYQFTSANVGTSDSRDSDADVLTGQAAVSLMAGERDFSVYAGLRSAPSRTTVRGQVWIDTNGNGVRDPGEPGRRTSLLLMDRTGTRRLAWTRTNDRGFYSFPGLRNGNYIVSLSTPQGFVLTVADQGSNEFRDSDFDPGSGRATVTISGGVVQQASVNAGLIYDHATGYISDRIWQDLNGNGLQDHGEPGLPGARVTLLDATGTSVLQTTDSDNDGNYRFTGLAAGTYLVDVTPPLGGRLTLQNQGTDDTRDSDADPETGRFSVTLVTGQRDTDSDTGVVFAPSSIIRGVVFDDDDDGIREGTDRRLSGVDVVLYEETGSAVLATTTTSGDGRYEFSGLSGGTYIVEFSTPSGFRISPQNAGTDDTTDSDIDDVGRVLVDLPRDTTRDGIDAGFTFNPATGSIVSRVWFDDNNNGLRDITEQPIDDAVVRLLSDDESVIARTTTDAGGFYRFEGLEAGDYTVNVQPPAGFSLTAADQGTDDSIDSDVDPLSGRVVVTAVAGTEVTNADAGLILTPSASISGRFFLDRDGDGEQDKGDGRTQGDVYLYDESGANLIAEHEGTANYRFSGLAAGTYLLELGGSRALSPPNVGEDDSKDSDFTEAGIVRVVVAHEEEVTSVDAGILPTASISGVVWVDKNGDGNRQRHDYAQAGVSLRLYDAESMTLLRAARTRRMHVRGSVYDTRFKFSNVPVGDYIVEVQAPDGHSLTRRRSTSDVDPSTGRVEVTVTESGTDRLSFGLFKNATGTNELVGTVWNDIDRNGRREDDEPRLPNQTVSLLVDNRLVSQTVTDDQGLWSFGNLPNDTFTVVVQQASGYQFTTSAAGGSSPLDSDVNDAGRHTVTVVGGETKQIHAGQYLESNAFIGGYVFNDSDKDGIREGWTSGKSVNIVLYDPATGKEQARTVSRASNGWYRFTGLSAEKEYEVRFTVPNGYTVSPKDNGNETKDSDVDAFGGGFAIVRTFASATDDAIRYFTNAGIYHASGSIGDRVWEDRNGNGIQDAGEPGLADVELLLLDRFGEPITATTTDAGGFYAFGFSDDEGTGDYSVAVTPPIGFRFTTANQGGSDATDSDFDPESGEAAISFVGGTTVSSLDAGLVRVTEPESAAISGFVWHDLNNNGLQETAEPGLDNAVVRLVDPDTRTTFATTTTRAGGHYAFLGLPSGEFQLEFDAGGTFDGAPQDQGTDDARDSDIDPVLNTVTVTLSEGEILTTVDAGFVTRDSGNQGRIGDTVWHDLNGDGIRQSTEPGLRGVTVQLRTDFGGGIIASTETDVNGQYSFTGLGATDYRVEVLPPGGFEFTAAAQGTDADADSDFNPLTGFSDVITLTTTTQIDNLDAGLITSTSGDTAVIGDRVFHDLNGNGLQDSGEPGFADVVVRLLSGDAAEVFDSTLTDAAGNYAFRGLAADDYLIEVVPPVGYRISPENVGTVEQLDSDIDTTFGRTETITLTAGQVLDSVDAGLIFDNPSTVRVATRLSHIVPGDDPDGSGPRLSIGHDAFRSFAELVTGLDNLTDGTVAQFDADPFGPAVLNRPGRLTILEGQTGTEFTTFDVTAGTARFEGSTTFTGGLTLGDGATLEGNGSVTGNVNAGQGSTVNPGGSAAEAGQIAAGIFTVDGNVDLQNGSTFIAEIGGTSAGTGPGFHDQLVATGTVDIGTNVSLTILAADSGDGNAFVPDADSATTFTIMRRSGGTGIFRDLPEGARILNFLNSDLFAVITYAGGDGQDIQLIISEQPYISLQDVSYREDQNNGDPVQVDSAAILIDQQGDTEWNGGTLRVQITSGSEPADEISIPDNVVSGINTSGNDLLSGQTVIGTLSSPEGLIAGNGALTITFNANATNAIVQDVIRAVSYRTTSESPNESARTLTVTATDTNGDSGIDTATISVTANNDPAAISFTDVVSVPEDADTSSAVKVANVVVSDPDGGTNTIGLAGDDMDFFNLVGAELFLIADTDLDFETKPTYSLAVTVDDTTIPGSPDASTPFTLNIRDVNEPPVVQAHRRVTQILESTILNDDVRIADVVILDDALGTNDVSLSGPDVAFFRLDGDKLLLKKGTELDYETKPAYQVTLNADDSAITGSPDSSLTLTLQVLDVYELAVAEVTLNATAVPSGQSVDFGQAQRGSAAPSLTFTLTNNGSGNLVVQPMDVTPGFAVTSGNFTSDQTLVPGATAEFTVEMETTTAGGKSGSLEFRTNDQNAARYRINLSGAVIQSAANQVVLPDGRMLIDDGRPGFTMAGNWRDVNGYGFGDHALVAVSSGGASTANWTFGDLDPGRYLISMTWLNGSDRSDNVSVRIRDGVNGPILSTLSINQKKRPAGSALNGRPFEDLNTVRLSGRNLVVEMSSAESSQAVVADAVIIESVTPPPNTPDINVLDSNGSLTDGSTFNFAPTTQGNPLSQQFTVRNDGTSDLILQPLTLTGTGFQLTSPNFQAGQVLPANAEVTFSVAVDTSTAGTRNGRLTLPSDDPDESPFDLRLAATVHPLGATVFFVDDGGPGFELTGNWINVPNYGFRRDAKVIGSNRTGTATWTFAGLEAGEYAIATTWLNGSDRSADVSYVVRDGRDGPILANVPVDQRLAPTGSVIEARPFADLGRVTITGDTLVVQLSNAGASGAVIADAVRIESFVPAPNSPQISVTSGTSTIPDNGRFNFGAVEQDTESLARIFTVKNTGTAPLILQPLEVTGSEFRLVSPNFSPDQTLAPDETATFTVEFLTRFLGTFSGTVSFHHNDGSANPFDFAVAGSVREAAPAGVYIIDNGDTGFSQTGTWATVSGYGYEQDAAAANALNGIDTARWEFTGLAAGRYEVSTTWLRGGDRADDVPFVIRDASTQLASASVDQTKNPSGSVYGGRPFETLGVVNFDGGTLIVEVSTLGTMKAVIVDAVRIQLIDADE